MNTNQEIEILKKACESIAPLDSKINVQVKYVKNYWLVSIEMNFPRGAIAVLVKNLSLTIALEKALKKQKLKIKAWKKLIEVEPFRMDLPNESDALLMYKGANKTDLHQGMNVVLVEDDPIAIHILESVILKDGTSIHSFTNPVEALGKISENQMDLIVLDWNLPFMTGGEFLVNLDQLILKRRNDNDSFQKIPVVVCSSLSREEFIFPMVKYFYFLDFWEKSLPLTSTLQSVLQDLKNANIKRILH